MKLIRPSVEFLGAVPTDYESAIKHIEVCGRLCYKSEDKITEDSAAKFVKKLCASGHLAMVEHSNFVVRADNTKSILHYLVCAAGKYLNVLYGKEYIYIGGNLTAWRQSYIKNSDAGLPAFFDPFIDIYNELFNISAISPFTFGEWEVCPHDEIPKQLHRYSAKFICDRGISHELVRHRPCSFAQSSTRYVNYGGAEIEFIEPWWWDNKSINQGNIFLLSCRSSEEHYHELIESGLSPQAARASLINALKTEVMVTADLQEWKHIFRLRCAKTAHPDFVRLAVPLRQQFIDSGLIE